MRYLVTWTSPIVFHVGDETESMGVYGVEGSKPGASAVATWLTHETLGLHKEGYGRLLGEAVFTCTKLYCHWATMTKPDEDLIVVPLIRLPAERSGQNAAAVEAEKERIRTKILDASNKALYEDKETWEFLAKLGGDLMINAFACNFKIDGQPNQDVVCFRALSLLLTSVLYMKADNPCVVGRSQLSQPAHICEDLGGVCEGRDSRAPAVPHVVGIRAKGLRQVPCYTEEATAAR